jgi:hypothetical protein
VWAREYFGKLGLVHDGLRAIGVINHPGGRAAVHGLSCCGLRGGYWWDFV